MLVSVRHHLHRLPTYMICTGYPSFRTPSARQVYIKTTRQVHRLYTRAVGGPALAAWIRYLDATWRQKKRQRAAVVIQRHARGYVVRGFALVFFLFLRRFW